MEVAYFVTGMGRSGTMWLAHLLDRDPHVDCGHERTAKLDARRYGLVRAGKMDVKEWFAERHILMERAYNGKPYADVNSYLRYVVVELGDEYGVPVAGLVRDGRYVVRSLMRRGVFRKPGRPPIGPPRDVGDDPFAKCCWYWADTYRGFDDHGVATFRLEDLNRDYGLFRELCDFLGARVNRLHWEQAAGKRVHVSIRSQAPPYWSDEQRRIFDRLAGDVQGRFGYARTA